MTWWPMGHAWLDYLARCQQLFQAGHFVADAAYFQGEWVPDYVPAKWAMNPSLPPGFDCTTVNAQTLTAHTRVGKDGCLILNETMSLRYLVLPQGGRWINPGLARLLSEMVPERDRASVASAPAPADKSLVISPAGARQRLGTGRIRRHADRPVAVALLRPEQLPRKRPGSPTLGRRPVGT